MSPVFEGEALTALQIELHLQAAASGETTVELPTEWASERELWRYVRDVEVEGATSVEDDGAAIRTIHAPPGTDLVFRYRIVTAYDHEPTAEDGQPFAPIVRPRWFYGFGEALFAIPLDVDSREPASFQWDGPPGFTFVSDLQQLDDGLGTIDEIRDSISIGGPDTKLYTETVGDAEVRVGIQGSFAFDDVAFVDTARSILATHRDFWGEHGEPFTITLAPLLGIPGHRSLGGTGRSDGFTILMSDDVAMDPVRHLLAHEYFHTWNPRRLGGQQDGDAEMLGKWFSEGFTEFYTWRLLLRSGIYDLQDFADDWNAALAEYAQSPARNVPNTRIAQAYWTDQAVGRIPYHRGPLLAAVWDQRLRRQTDGAVDLDDVLHAMRETIRADEASPPDAATLFLQTYAAKGGPDISDEVRRWIDDGETIVLPADVFGACLRVVSEPDAAAPQQVQIVGAETPAERLQCAREVSTPTAGSSAASQPPPHQGASGPAAATGRSAAPE